MRIRTIISAVFIFISCSIAVAQSLDYDKKVGKENSALVEQQMGVYQNQEMNAYVASIGQSLVKHLEEPLFSFQFKLIESEEPNAFALPGGYVYVTTGLIPILQTEDELACILAHEIIHANNRHSVKQMRKGILPVILAVPGAMVGVLNNTMGSILTAPSELMIAGYSRKYETEADLEGIKLAARAGYNPHALKSALTRMSTAIEVLYNQKEEKSYFSDHPFTPDRVKNINKIVGELEIKTAENNQANFIGNFDGILFGQHPRRGLVAGNTIINPGLNASIDLPKNWMKASEANRMMGYAPNQSAAVVIALEEEFKTAKEAADKFQNSLPPEYKANSFREVHNMPKTGANGEMIALREQTSQGLVFAHVLWVKHQGQLLKIIGMCTREHVDEVLQSMDNLRKISEQDQDALVIRKMRVTSCQNSVENCSKEQGNVVPVQYIKAINGLTGEQLESKELKIIVQTPYNWQ